MKLKRSEADVKRSVQELLKSLGIMTFRMNAGDRFGSHNGKTWKIAGHPAGTADILCFVNSVLWIETKSSTGKQSPEQKQFQGIVENSGHTYLLVRSADEVSNWLKENM